MLILTDHTPLGYPVSPEEYAPFGACQYGAIRKSRPCWCVFPRSTQHGTRNMAEDPGGVATASTYAAAECSVHVGRGSGRPLLGGPARPPDQLGVPARELADAGLAETPARPVHDEPPPARPGGGADARCGAAVGAGRPGGGRRVADC